MKNSQIHLGLKDSNLRDFLSVAMVKNLQQECENKKTVVPYNAKDTSGWVVKDIENEIAFQEKRLKILKERQVITTMIEMQGWLEFDVSDETEKDLKYKTKINFIGTQQEYADFIKKLERE